MEEILKHWNIIILVIPMILGLINYIVQKKYFLNYFIDLLSTIFAVTAFDLFILTFPFINIIGVEQLNSLIGSIFIAVALFLIVFILIIEVTYIIKVKNYFVLFKTKNIKGILQEKKNKKDRIKIKYTYKIEKNYNKNDYLIHNTINELNINNKEEYTEKFYYTNGIFKKLKSIKKWWIYLIGRILLSILSIAIPIILQQLDSRDFFISIISLIFVYILIIFFIIKNAYLIPLIQNNNINAMNKELRKFN
ncbi:hypothetical protein I3V70_05535 [Staphylococcus schleiferi]|nr:hypothetical protein [Staphylococcus epidermidis]MBF9297559.1 hypothetical protein [Staphylococcus schleiferi]